MAIYISVTYDLLELPTYKRKLFIMAIRNVKSVALINRMTECDYHYMHVYLELYSGTSA